MISISFGSNHCGSSLHLTIVKDRNEASLDKVHFNCFIDVLYQVILDVGCPASRFTSDLNSVAGVLGDVDGDGNMDMISIVDGEGKKKDGSGNHLGMSYAIRIVKTNLVDALNTRGRYPAKLDLFVAKKMRDVRGIKPIEKVQFRPLAKQPWTQYLGRRSDNIYP